MVVGRLNAPHKTRLRSGRTASLSLSEFALAARVRAHALDVRRSLHCLALSAAVLAISVRYTSTWRMCTFLTFRGHKSSDVYFQIT